jgi:hypothetical protein
MNLERNYKPHTGRSYGSVTFLKCISTNGRLLRSPGVFTTEPVSKQHRRCGLFPYRIISPPVPALPTIRTFSGGYLVIRTVGVHHCPPRKRAFSFRQSPVNSAGTGRSVRSHIGPLGKNGPMGNRRAWVPLESTNRGADGRG